MSYLEVRSPSWCRLWMNAGHYNVPPQRERSQGLRVMRRIGEVALVAQLFFFFFISVVQVHKFALTWDFAINLQFLYQISHLHWAAHDSLFLYNPSFFRIHGVFLETLLGILYRFWPSPYVLLWSQDLFIVLSELFIFYFMLDFLAHREARGHSRRSAQLATIGLVLLLFNPWIYATSTFDYHSEPLATFLTLLTMRAAFKDHLTWIFYLGLAILGGDLANSYLLGSGIGLFFVGRHYWRKGVLITLTGAVATYLLSSLKFDLGSPVAGFNYLVGAPGVSIYHRFSAIKIVTALVAHPLRVFDVLWSRHVDIIANIAPSGFIGLFTPWTLWTVAFNIVTNGLPFQGFDTFIVPMFQNFPDYLYVPLGTIIWLAWLTGARRALWRWVGWLLAVASLINVVGWTYTWSPGDIARWMPVDSATSSTLRTVLGFIPQQDEVIASQGIVGLFANRESVYELNTRREFPVTTPNHTVWVVIVPDQGIEVTPQQLAESFITGLMTNPEATEVLNQNDVHLFRVNVPFGQSFLKLSTGPASVAVYPGADGTALTSGPIRNWAVEAIGPSGSLVSFDYFRRQPSHYLADIEVHIEGSLKVEIWNDSTKTMLFSTNLPSNPGFENVYIPFTLSKVAPDVAYSGKWIWRTHPFPSPIKNQVEIRLYCLNGAGTIINRLQINPNGRYLEVMRIVAVRHHRLVTK